MARAAAPAEAAIAAFSTAASGAALPSGWRRIAIPGVKRNEFALVAEDGRTVLRVRSESAAGSAAHDLAADPGATPVLAWRWKVERALDRAAWGTKEGDDFAARIYVTFDLPLDRLPLAERAKIRLGRALFGSDLPAAALCYVWASREPVGTSGWNPYADRVRMIVVESGNARAGQWVAESRDVEADFRAAFGGQWKGPVPRVSGVLLSSDTDQTNESVTAWFGDLRLEAKR